MIAELIGKKIFDSIPIDKLNDLDLLNSLQKNIGIIENQTKVKSVKFKNSDIYEKDCEKQNTTIFNQAPNGLWYNWANSSGKKYFAVTYSAGVTQILQSEYTIPEAPLVYIYNKDQINADKEVKPKYEIRLTGYQSIRSALMIDDVCEPYLLLGTFTYPKKEVVPHCAILKYSFKKGIVEEIIKIENSNSIKNLKRYINKDKCIDVIIYTKNNDFFSNTLASLYYIKTKYVSNFNNITDYVKIKNLTNQHIDIFGNVWFIEFDKKTIYLSISLQEVDSSKLSGFTIKGRFYYNKISNLFDNDIEEFSLISLIGNEVYPAGFGIESISAFQIQTTKKSEYIYLYSLSDMLYQVLGFINNPESNISQYFENITDFFSFVNAIREIVANLDFDGTRIFVLNKKDLYKSSYPIIKTIIGNAPPKTINLSCTNNGFNNFLNVYTWSSTSDKCQNELYFGTLDLRATIYTSFANIIKSINPVLSEILLSLPNQIIIQLTEYFLNINFSYPIDFTNTELYFDIIKIDEKHNITKLTSNGFSNIENLGLFDSGIRNLNIIKNCNGKFLLSGTTCYQVDNSAKIYITVLK